jgi:hypothetical protein
MLSVASKLYMLSVVMQSVVMLNIAALGPLLQNFLR